MTAVTQDIATSVVISAWRNHTSMTKQVAARLAGELATRPPRSRIESSQAIADKYGVSKTMVDNARHLLIGAKLIYKVERRYYTGQPEENLTQIPTRAFARARPAR
jgi:DNA-binding transcriptional MocR family regulator